tara:strand:- start:467 stop:964 length:498 start_codon:yes stop_codon:yes gene_type:complete
MFKSIQLLTLFLGTLSFSCISCDKDIDLGYQPDVIDSLISSTGLLVEVTGFENLDGDIAIAIYNSSETFNSETTYYRDSAVTVSANSITIHFDYMDPGTYAISVLHDTDQSGDMGMGGLFNLIPQEGFGFSNNPEIGFSEPKFDVCKFELEEGLIVFVPISLIYM